VAEPRIVAWPIGVPVVDAKRAGDVEAWAQCSADRAVSSALLELSFRGEHGG
jgi:hypothetical protein